MPTHRLHADPDLFSNHVVRDFPEKWVVSYDSTSSHILSGSSGLLPVEPTNVVFCSPLPNACYRHTKILSNNTIRDLP